MTVKCLAQEHISPATEGTNSGPFDPESSTLAIRSLYLAVPLHYKAKIYELQPSVECPWSYTYFSGIRVS